MLGARIAALRREAGMSQAQLAKELKISASAVGMYEQGRREPSADMLLQIARLFDVSMEYLVDGSLPREQSQKICDMILSRIEAADARADTRADRPFTRQELAALYIAILTK